MKLSTYLERQRVSYAEFARQIGAGHRRTVERYAKGSRLPSRALMERIVQVTDGAVQANDFYVTAD